MTTRNTHYYIPSSYSRIVARELGLQESALVDLLAGTGLPPAILMPGDETHMTAGQQLQVLHNARHMGASDDFGLCLGRQLGPQAHGPMGYLALSSPDLMTALEALRDFLPLRIPFVSLDLTIDRHCLYCTVEFKLQAEPAEMRLLLECFALVIQSVAEAVLGRQVNESRVDFTYPRPTYHRRYSHYLRSKIRFSQTQNVYVLPLRLAHSRNAAGDPQSYGLARDLCRRLLDRSTYSASSTTIQVRRLLLSQPPGFFTEEDIARSLFVSKRTLARRLDRENNGYRQIHDEVLSELATQYLLESKLSVEAIAELLGYHDSANFRRAFRRWRGMPPGAYRQRFS